MLHSKPKAPWPLLKGRPDLGVIYSTATSDSPPNLEAWVDSDWASCPDTRFSRTGVAITCGGDLLHWRGSKQHSHTLSSAKPEFIAASQLVRDLSWLRQLAEEWSIPLRHPPIQPFPSNSVFTKTMTTRYRLSPIITTPSTWHTRAHHAHQVHRPPPPVPRKRSTSEQAQAHLSPQKFRNMSFFSPRPSPSPVTLPSSRGFAKGHKAYPT